VLVQADRPSVSIIMPTFRRVDFLREALESALNQTFTDFELIVTDNAMSQETVRTVASYGDPRVRYRHNGSNIGALRNALAGFREARGEFVASLHDDDSWEPSFLEQLVPPLQEDPGLALSFCDHYVMDIYGVLDVEASEENSRLWGRAGLRGGSHTPFAHLALVDRSVPVAMAAVLRRSAVDWNDVPHEVGAVYDLWLAYLASREGHGAFYVPERLTRYRVHGGADSASSRHAAENVYAYSRFLADDRLADLHAELRLEAASFLVSQGLDLLRAGQRVAARRALWAGLRHRADRRAAAGLALSLLPLAAERWASKWGRKWVTSPAHVRA